jgi:hypothetical protein
MNATQIIYAIALAGVFAFRPGFVAWWLLANMTATLAACFAMDIGALDRDGATLSIMIIDLATGAFLATRPGLPRIIAAAYVVMVPLYSLTIVLDVQSDTTFAIVNGIAFMQLAVAGIGSSGDSGGGGLRGFDGLSDHLATSFRIDPMGQGGMAMDRHLLSADSRGLTGGRE